MLRHLGFWALAFLSVGCGRGSGAVEASPAIETAGVPIDSVLIDDNVLVPGMPVNTRDLQYRIEDLRHRLSVGDEADPKRPKMEATIEFIESARSNHSQCLRFRVVVDGKFISLEPLDDLSFEVPGGTRQFDVIVIGGEIESVTTAMAFARKGKSVGLIYAGPLGGLCSDEGGNLRFFDGYWKTPRPDEQRELYRSAFRMGDFVALPTQMHRKIRDFINSQYANRIELIEVDSYEGLRVNRSNDRIDSIDTKEVGRLEAQVFVDAEPESRIAEKAGLPFDSLTPNLPYGLVFDIPQISRFDILSLIRNIRLSPEAIAAFAGVDLALANSNSFAKAALEKLRKDIATDFAHDRGNYWLGFKAAAEGFNLYMQLKGMTSDDERLKFLNRARRTSGFNIALNGGVGNFNSISYSFGFTILQHAHSLTNDDRLRAIREVEIPELQKFMRYVTGNENLWVRIPDQFYVRKSTAHFKTKHPYVRTDFKREQPESGNRWMMYPMDYRSISPRNQREKVQFNRLFWSGDVVYWQCRPNVCETEIENLFLLNKSMLTPEFSGATRILQNFITTGVALAVRLNR
jgi:hypothetical protein